MRAVPARRCSSGMASSYTKILVHDLQLDMHIGIYDHELKAAQRVLVCVEATIRDNPNWDADAIENTFSYEDVVNAANDIAARGHINLVETYAERIAEFCLQNPLVMAVKIIIKKPDIFPAADFVGVEIYRIRA